MVKTVMKKLGHISTGEWGKHKLQCVAWGKHKLQHTVQTHAIPVYEVELPDINGLKIIWSVDYGFSIRSYSTTQLVKVWAVTADQEQIHKILECLSIVHQVYTSKKNDWCIVEQIDKDDVVSPMQFEDEEETTTFEDQSHIDDDERSLEVHNMLVTNKFYPLSTVKYA